MVADITEAVTDTMTVFQNICSFFPGATCLQFFKSVYLFVEQTCFFQEMLSEAEGISTLTPVQVYNRGR